MSVTSDADNKKSKTSLPIKGLFSNEELSTQFKSTATRKKLKYFIEPHAGFEIVQTPKGTLAKLAYNKLFTPDMDDLDIELSRIAKYERVSRSSDKKERELAKINLKVHYKKAVRLMSPRMADGWNRWSENILDHFLSDKLHKVLWGSGNCGKSATYALLLYIKWRVRPHKRMVVIASKVVLDASARVFGYIKEIHTEAPASQIHQFALADGNKHKGIYCLMLDEKTQKYVKNDRACIVNLPVKVDARKKDAPELGANLLGKHPDDILVLAFDEAQELPGMMLEMKIFLNWYTNQNLEIHAWGNPIPVNFHEKTEQDLLFRLGGGRLSLESLKKLERRAEKTDTWTNSDTTVLRFSMLDSPKDDEEERNAFLTDENGMKVQRLHFLAGKENVEIISRSTSPNSPAWYSQVLGFPFIDREGTKGQGILTPYIITAARRYPLLWKPETPREWFMGVDPSITGHRDHCSIVCAEVGMMQDARNGLDAHNGKYCRHVKPIDDEEFVDTTINVMWELSKLLNIPLKNIGIETHGVGEVYRYALQQHIEDGKWEKDAERGQRYEIISPSQTPTDRYLFKQFGKLLPTVDMVQDAATEFYVAVRCYASTRQLFNIPEYILSQFYTRYLQMNSNQTKYKVESKDDMLKRGLKSPNDADAFANVLEVARRRGKMKLKFYNKSEYTMVFGDEYTGKQKQKAVEARLGIVSSALGISLGLGNTVSNINKRKYDIDPV